MIITLLNHLSHLEVLLRWYHKHRISLGHTVTIQTEYIFDTYNITVHKSAHYSCKTTRPSANWLWPLQIQHPLQTYSRLVWLDSVTFTTKHNTCAIQPAIVYRTWLINRLRHHVREFVCNFTRPMITCQIWGLWTNTHAPSIMLANILYSRQTPPRDAVMKW